MAEGLRGWMLRLVRVPPTPRVPAGAEIRVFRAAPGYFRYKAALWLLGQISAVGGLVGGLFAINLALPHVGHPVLRFLLHVAEAVAWLAFLVQLPISLMLLRLDFEMRWYILSDRSLRIREGILTVREKTMTFANIQQTSIRQNPLQRLLGIQDVQVRTAGGGGGSAGSRHGHGEVGEAMHEAYFRGVDNAEEIRTAILERVRLHRDSGLGDPDEPEPDLAPAAVSPPVAAAHELLAEIRALRSTLTA